MTALAIFAGAVCGCASELDTSRESVDQGTFGATVATLACKRIAYLEDLNDGDGVTDVRGDTYRDICRLGFPPIDDPRVDEAPDALLALQAKRDTLVPSIDATFPEGFLGDLQGFLTSNEFLALYDDGTTIAAIDSLIAFLEFTADDPEMAEALERYAVRLGYMPVEPALGTVRAVVNYPDLHDFLLAVGDAITEGGSARGEWDNMIRAASVTLRNAEPVADPAAVDRTGNLVMDLLFTEQPLLGTSRTIPLARRDYRGVARVGNGLPEPFVDMDADGLADTDELGRYVDASGTVLAVPSPFELPEGDEQVPWNYRDGQGRPLQDDGGALIYEYIDLDKTLFAALVRDGIDLFDPQKGTALDMLRGGSALMGPRQMVTRTYETGDSVEYRGYDTDQAPLLDMAHAYLGLLADPNIHDTIDLARALFTDHEQEVARLTENVVRAARMGDAHPEAELEPGSPIWDDLMPVIRQILAEPGLAEDLMRALEDPAVADVGVRFADYMKYKDRFDLDPNTQQVTGSFSTPVDRSASDSGFNRSLMQRLLHLIHDSNGASLCNKQDARITDPLGLGLPLAFYDECDLFQLDNLAVFYVQSIAYAKDGSGNVITDGDGNPVPKAILQFNFDNFLIEAIVTDELLEDMTTIEGFTSEGGDSATRYHVTPQALNRMLLLDPAPAFLADVVDPAVDNDGDLFIAAHTGTLPVWEKNGFYDQIRPVVQAFADHDAEQLFVDILAVLHQHWPSRDSLQHQQSNPQGHGYAWASNVASWELLLVDVLEDRGLLDALVATAPALNAVSVNGKSFAEIATDAGRYLVTPQPGLANRFGETTSETSDGRPVNTLSPWQLLGDAYAAKQARIEAAAAEGEAWQGSMSNVIDTLVRADPVPTIGWQFRNPRFRGITVQLLDFVQTRLRAHQQAGDVDTWLHAELVADLESTFSSPLFAGAADFVLSLQASPEARRQLEALMAYLVNEINYDDAFRTSLTALADMVQLSLDDDNIVPVARVIGEAIRPERGWLQPQLDFVIAARRTDENEALVAMLRNLYVDYRPGHTAVGDLIDGISEVHRARPWEDLGERYTAADYRSLLRGVAHFLDEEKRGLRKFIKIIEGRNL